MGHGASKGSLSTGHHYIPVRRRSNTSMEELEDEAIRLLDAGSLRCAERVCRRLLVTAPDCLAAHFHLARVYRRMSKYRLALRHAKRTLRLDPGEPGACLNLGLVYDLMGRDRQAVLYYRKELSRDPNSAETLWNIGRLYFRRRRWRRASEHLRRCFDLGFKFQVEDTVDKLGLCYKELRDVQSYIDLFTAYLRRVPDASWALANLGRAMLYAGDYKGAVLRLSKARAIGVRISVDAELSRAKELLLKETTERREQFPGRRPETPRNNPTNN